MDKDQLELFNAWFYRAKHRAKYTDDHPAYLAAQEAWEAWLDAPDTPPRQSRSDVKPWVGLTQEQRASIAEANNMLVDDDLFDAIEAKLREKNELREKNA